MTEEEIKNLTKEQAREICKKHYNHGKCKEECPLIHIEVHKGHKDITCEYLWHLMMQELNNYEKEINKEE